MENRGPYVVAYPTCPLNWPCHGIRHRGVTWVFYPSWAYPLCTFSHIIMHWINVTFILPKNGKVIACCNMCINTIYFTSCMGFLCVILSILCFLLGCHEPLSMLPICCCFTLSLLFPYRHSACLFTTIIVSLSPLVLMYTIFPSFLTMLIALIVFFGRRFALH